jgi:predicted small lipoprotein YifL
MCSRKLTLWLLVAILIPACGRKEPPQPPPSKTPAPLNDLQIQQRGPEILLQMSYPSITLSGLPIEDLEAIEIWKTIRIVPSFAETEIELPGAEIAGEDTQVEAPPEPEEPAEPEASLFSLPGATAAATPEESKEDLIMVEQADFAAGAELAWTLRGAALDSAVVGDKLFIRLPLEETIPPTDEDAVLVLAARSLASQGKPSPFSNLVKLAPRTPPAPPTDLVVEPTPQGIEIEWKTGEGEIGYRIYRRNANVRDFDEPIASPRMGESSHLDSTAEFGKRYIYTVTSVVSEEPLVESGIAAEHEVNYKDLFPPEAPRDVVALPETGRVRLLWKPSVSEDTEGYWIYRQDPGESSYRAINVELVVGSEYLDRDLIQGQVYRYYILAVDGKENQSEPSEEIEVRVP